jgi:hypothetical protein
MGGQRRAPVAEKWHLDRKKGLGYTINTSMEGKMEKAIEQLEEVNKRLDVIIDIMKTPKNRIIRILEIIAVIAGAFSILSIIDIVRNWLSL